MSTLSYIVPTVSHTFLDTGQRCLRKLENRYVHRIYPRVKGVKLERGTWVHELLAEFYRSYRAMQESHGYLRVEELVDAAQDCHAQMLQTKWNPLWDEEKEAFGSDFPDTCWAIFERYVEHWKTTDTHNIRKILFVERSIKVKVPWLPVPFDFKCDLVYVDRLGIVWIMDHKVVGTIPDEDDRMLDTQGARYILGFTELLKQKGIQAKGVGVIYDYIRDRLPAEPKVNKDGSLSKAKIDTDYVTYKAAIEKHGLNPDDYKDTLNKISREQRPYFDRWPVPKSPQRLERERVNMAALAALTLPEKGYYPMSLEKSCNWGCEYKELCMIQLEGGDISQALQDRFEVKASGDDAGAARESA